MLGGAWHEDFTVLVVLVDHPGIGARELRRPGHDRAQYGLKIQCGINRLTDLAQRAKLAHGAGQVIRPGFELSEEPDVFDGDDRLISEGCHQVDLSIGELPDFGPPDYNGPD